MTFAEARLAELTASESTGRSSGDGRRTDLALVAIVLGCVAGLAYCSWPLGSVLNPALASTGLASDLEAAGQPFNWLFVLLDCVTGAATLSVGVLLWSEARRSPTTRMRAALVGYVLFGLVTAANALIPTGCASGDIASCGADLASPSLDDALTGLSVLALFLSVCWAISYRSSIEHRAPVVRVAKVLVVTWGACGLVFFAEHFSTRPAVSLQHAMLTLSSAIALVVPVLLVRWPPRPSRRGPLPTDH